MSSLIEKLKPSSRNKIIAKKFNLNTEQTNANTHTEPSEYDLRNFDIDPVFEGISASSFNNEQWNKIVKQRKQETLHLEISTSGVFNNHKNNFDESLLSENLENLQNLEDINNFIEENYQMVLTENIFITNPELYHSTLPFLLITSKEIHRMSLSDYEIKLVYKSFKNKLKTHRIDCIDYYKIGLINFYEGKFLRAYTNFKMAYSLRKDANIAKWLAFTSLVLIFCHGAETHNLNVANEFTYNDFNQDTTAFNNNIQATNKLYNTKINFTRLKDIIFQELKEEIIEEESFLFGCCQNRKKKTTLNQVNNINLNVSYPNPYKNETLSHSILTENNLQQMSINKFSLCLDTETLLNEALVLDKEEKHFVEIYWMLMIISVYTVLRPDQRAFSQMDPKSCVKKIKNKDVYLGYLVYAECNLLLQENFKIKPILSELVSKFPQRIEAYLKYWNLLVKGKEKDFKLAHQLSEVFWKNASTIHFDNNVYYLYITITHAKSLYYLGNNFYTITYFQKEYPANFLYPSIFYLFGKYSSKSNSKSLKNVALSSLFQVYKLLHEDLQNSALYWIGNVYFNCGNYDLCFKVWKLYLENSDNCFDLTEKKLEKIKNFIKNYELLGNSLNEFKKNLNYLKVDHIKKNIFERDIDQVKDFLSDLKAIKELYPNIKENFQITYEFYRGLIHFFVEKNFDYAIRIFMNVIHDSPFFMESYFAIWKILKIKGDIKVLLNFSYFMVRNSHSSDVSYEDWIRAYTLYAKALFIAQRYDDAVECLRNLLDVFANIPLDEIKFLNEIHKSNRISTMNNFVNFDHALTFYSKFHVYKKSEAIFHFNFKSKSGKDKFKRIDQSDEFREKYLFSRKSIPLNVSKFASHVNANVDTKNTTATVNKESNLGDAYLDTLALENSIGPEIEAIEYQEDNMSLLNSIKKDLGNLLKMKSCNEFDVEIEDINIDNVDKLEDYVERNIEKVEIPEEYTFITIIANPVVLYEIGKFCAKSQLKSEMGLYCLKDYISLLKFQYNYELGDYNLIKKYKALFYIGVIKCNLGQYKLAKETFEKIKKIPLLEDKINKLSFMKYFIDFYKKYLMDNRLTFDFDSNKKFL